MKLNSKARRAGELRKTQPQRSVQMQSPTIIGTKQHFNAQKILNELLKVNYDMLDSNTS